MDDVLSDLLAEVQAKAATSAPVDVLIGAHWTFVSVEWENEKRGGLSTSLSGYAHTQPATDHHHGGRPPVRDAGHLLSYSVGDLAALVRSQSLVEASVGMATINALLDVDESQCVVVNASDVIGERGRGGNVAVVGHFPFVDRLHSEVENLWVLELDPGAGDLPAEKAPDVLPRADVVALTGTSLLNRTFEGLMSLCRQDAFVIVLGATTPLSSVLFNAGVDAVAGTLVVDPLRVVRAVSEGATFRQITGKRLVTMFKR